MAKKRKTRKVQTEATPTTIVTTRALHVAGKKRSRQPALLNDMASMLKRINSRISEMNTTQTAVSIAAGMSKDGIANWKKQHKKGIQHGISPPNIKNVAKVLQVSPNWILAGIDGPQRDGVAHDVEAKPIIPDNTTRVKGEVAPGIWVDKRAEFEAADLFVPTDPRYDSEDQCAYLMKDNSIDRVAKPGDYLLVVPTKYRAPQNGDIVVMSHYDQAQKREIIARRYVTLDNEIELRIDATSIDAKGLYAPIRFKPGQKDMTFEGVVVSIYRPVVRDRE